jgi:NADP-dependent 3-hydroxy acid dehydrogenase YdfG
MSNITNKLVAITGASSGIGESAAKLLAEQGAHLREARFWPTSG